MTTLWFFVWILADVFGSREPILFDPVNAWAMLLLLCVAMDLRFPPSARVEIKNLEDPLDKTT